MTVKAAITFLIAGLTGLVLSGCSAVVASGGKNMNCVFVSDASLQSIRHQLGPPTAQVAYPRPQAASGIPEIVTLSKFSKNLSLATTLGSCEEYAYKGRVHDERDTEMIDTLDIFTLGVGDILMFPSMVRVAKSECHQTHRYRVWYRPDGSYFVHVELCPSLEESK